MANTLTNVIPQLLAQGLLALREMAIMPLLVNRQYETMAGPQGSSIDIPLPSAVAVQDVTPAATPPSTADQEPGTVAITLDRWKEAPFYLTDKDMLEVQNGTLPMMASEAIRSLANEVDQFILGLGTKFYGVHGTAGTTPFSTDISDATQIRKVLNNQLCPLDNRRLVMNPDAEAEALELRAFHDASFGVGGEAILEGQITRRLGFDWYMDQNVQTHTAGAAAGYQTNLGTAATVGTKTLAIDTGSGAFAVGDIITFANHAQTYVVTASVGGASATSISIEPGLTTAVGDGVAITGPGDTGGIGTHDLNLAFHRDAIGFVTRPLQASNHPASIIESAVDPVSGLTLRLEVTREHKRDRFSYDILYGANVIRRELGARLLG